MTKQQRKFGSDKQLRNELEAFKKFQSTITKKEVKK